MVGFVDRIDHPQNYQPRVEAEASNRRFDRQRSLASLGVLAKTGLNLTMK